MIATLPAFDNYGGHNTVYGAHEIAPTILLNAAKGYPPLVAVERAPAPQKRIEVLGSYGSGFYVTRTIYGTDGLAPTQWATQGRDPIKIMLEGDP